MKEKVPEHNYPKLRLQRCPISTFSLTCCSVLHLLFLSRSLSLLCFFFILYSHSICFLLALSPLFIFSCLFYLYLHLSFFLVTISYAVFSYYMSLFSYELSLVLSPSLFAFFLSLFPFSCHFLSCVQYLKYRFLSLFLPMLSFTNPRS